MAYSAPTSCPVCGKAMQVTKLRCPRCESELTGRFVPCRFCALPEKELRFIEVFLRCRGSIKDVERTLGISYPTVRNMLDGALRALGLEDGPEAVPEEVHDTRACRREILDRLECGEIDAGEAAKLLKALQ